MGMSTHVIGFVPPDEKWHQMKAVWDACKAAGVNAPDEVYAFFGDHTPDEAGVEIEIQKTDAVEEWSHKHSSGYQVHIDKIPPHVKIIRFYNSW